MARQSVSRHILAENVEKGDTIRVIWTVGDVEHTRTGKVDRIIHSLNGRARSFITADGNVIAEWVPTSRVTITLVAKAPAEQVPLFI